MSEKYLDWLVKLKKKYREEIDNLEKEEYQYLVTNYRFESSTLLFILTMQFPQCNRTMLIVNHNSPFKESCKYLGSIKNLDNQIEDVLGKIELIIDENKELLSIKQNLLKFFELQLKREVKPQGKGTFVGGGTIGRDSWYRFMFEGNFEDISVDDFFKNAIKEARDLYHNKKRLDEDIRKRDISVEEIELITISDSKIKLLIYEMRKDLEKITDNMTTDLKNAFINRSVIIENKALEKYDFLPEESKGSELFQEILPIENLTIQADLDSRRFTIQVRGLYGYLIEEILQKYIINPTKIEDYVIEKINEFITSYKTKKILYKILLPLNGIIVNTEVSYEQTIIPFSEIAGLLLFDDAVIITKESDLILGRTIHYNRDDIEKGTNHAFSIYCEGTFDFKFRPKNSLFFNFDRTEPISINESTVWLEIRNIFSSFILSNFKIGYSKQFYKFPWWIPKKTYQYDFPTPDWLRDVMYFNPSQKMSIDRIKFFQIKDLVPKSYLGLSFPHHIDKEERTTFTLGDISNGIGFFMIEQGRNFEMSFQERNLRIPSEELQFLRNQYAAYSNKKNPINFFSSQFIIKQIINLRLREKIEESILDSCLIIESLLVSGDRELAYQFRLHASLLISNDINDLENNISFFKNLYGLRSQIIHGTKKWDDTFRKFLNKHTRWKFTKSEWNNGRVEHARDELLNLIFLKILYIIMRINEIGLSLKSIKKTVNLIANLKFNPLDINLEEINKLEIECTKNSQENRQQKILKKLIRIEKKLISIIDSEKDKSPIWLKKLNIAINNLKNGHFESFQKIICALAISEREPKTNNQIVFNSLLINLEKIKEEICSEKK